MQNYVPLSATCPGTVICSYFEASKIQESHGRARAMASASALFKAVHAVRRESAEPSAVSSSARIRAL